MRKLTALTDFIIKATGVPRENFAAFIDQGDLQPIGRHLGLLSGENGEPDREQIEVGFWKYDALIQIERYDGDGPTLAAQVLGWLQTFDPDRADLALPQLDVHLNDGKTCDCDISCEFEEVLTAIEDENGPIHFGGKRWKLEDLEIVPVESFTMHGRIKG